MQAWEKKTIDWAVRHLLLLSVGAVVLTALYLRLLNLDFHSRDYDVFLLPWFERLRDGGGFQALGDPIGNYNVPYLTILALLTYLPVEPIVAIKSVSIVFDFLMAAGAAKLVFLVLKQTDQARTAAFLAFTAVLALPTVFLNSAYWAQCDSIYTAFLLFCLAALVEERYTAAFILFAAAFCFKMQALLFLPVLVLLYVVKRKFSVLQFLWIPALLLVSVLPAVFAGRGLWDTLTIYLRQADEYPHLTLNYPNLYYFLRGEYNTFSGAGIAVTLCLLLMFAVWLLRGRRDIGPEGLIPVSLWVMLVCLMFLPSMHERYGYPTDVLSVLYVFGRKNRWYVPLVVCLSSLLSYTGFLFRYWVFDLSWCAVAKFVLLAALTSDLGKILQTRQSN